MSINKDMHNVECNKYRKKNKNYNKEIHDKNHEKYIEEDEIFYEDIYDETSDKDVNEDELYKIFSEDYDKNKDNKYDDDDKKKGDKYYKEEPKIFVNCKLKVDFDTKNKMIYLFPGKSQYFTVDVFKCCGDVTIKYKGCYKDNGIRGNLAVYKIIESGIIAEAYSKIDPKKKDFLKFIAIDECTKECFDFVVVFSSSLCTCC